MFVKDWIRVILVAGSGPNGRASKHCHLMHCTRTNISRQLLIFSTSLKLPPEACLNVFGAKFLFGFCSLTSFFETSFFDNKCFTLTQK